MEIQSKNLTLKEILALQSAIKLLNDTNQYIDFESKIRLGIIQANISIITTQYYEELEKERKRIIEEFNIDIKDEKSIQENEQEFTKILNEHTKSALEGSHLVAQVPIFTSKLFNDWREESKGKKDKDFDPPIIFYQLISFLIKEE